MAEAATTPSSTLSEDYLLKEKEVKPDQHSNPVEVKEVNGPASAVSEVVEKAEETPVADVTEDTPPATDGSTETNPAMVKDSSEDAPPAAEESTESTEEEKSGDQETKEEQPEIKLETAPADYRFPTTNQTRHCFTRYIEYHRCIAAKGEGAPECDKFAKYYRSLCPDEWIERWNEQRANGTFPGPL